MNQTLFASIHNLSLYAPTMKAAYFISYPLSYSLPFALIIYFLVKHKRPLYAFSLLVSTGISAWVGSFLLKLIFHIPRPVSLEKFFDIGGYSFPSAHAAVYAALTIALYSLRPSWGIIMAFITLLVGVSRIVLGVHMPVDVLGGFLIGGVIGYILVRNFKKI